MASMLSFLMLGEEEEPMTGFEEIEERDMLMYTLRLALFIIAVYGGGAAMKYINGPALVAEILVGLLFASLHWFPMKFINAFKCLGYLGLLLMIFDGGVHMDI